MSIDEAIRLLNLEKEAGNEHVVLAYWTADSFNKKEGDAWADAADMGDDIDWSDTHDRLCYAMNIYDEEEVL